MTEETRPALDLDSDVPADGNPTPPGPIQVAERRAARPARHRAAVDLPPPRDERPGLFSPSLFYFLGAVMVAATWLGHLNPRAPVIDGHRLWPWQLFRENLAAGGDPVFGWTYAHAIALVLAVVGLFYLIASLMRPTHGRGAAALLLTIPPIVLLWPDATTPVMYTVALVASIAAGAVILRHDGRRLARGVLFVSTLLLGAMLFFPLPGDGTGYQARIFDLSTPVRELLGDTMRLGLPRLGSGDGVHLMLLVILGVLGLLAAVGLRRRWVRIAAGVALLLLIALPLLLTQVFGLDGAPPAEPDVVGLLNQSFWLWTLYLSLVFVAALASWLGLGGRWATWLGGVALLLLAFDHPATLFREAMSPDSLAAGMRATSQHLGQGAFAAFLLPVAAFVMDLARPRT